MCSGAHSARLVVAIFQSSKQSSFLESTMTKLIGALIGTGLFIAIGTALAHAQAIGF